jgi:hypothetical protein
MLYLDVPGTFEVFAVGRPPKWRGNWVPFPTPTAIYGVYANIFPRGVHLAMFRGSSDLPAKS